MSGGSFGGAIGRGIQRVKKLGAGPGLPSDSGMPSRESAATDILFEQLEELKKKRNAVGTDSAADADPGALASASLFGV